MNKPVKPIELVSQTSHLNQLNELVKGTEFELVGVTDAMREPEKNFLEDAMMRVSLPQWSPLEELW